MPSTTFHRLNPKKRGKFLNEAYIEFSINSFQGASVTNLVKTLGIAKGSVYQYFDDKEDLYRYLIEEIMRQLNELLDKACPYDGEEFFTWYTKALVVQLKYFLSFPAHGILLRNVNAGVVKIDRRLRTEIYMSLSSRINLAVSANLYNSEINNYLLTQGPILLFDLLTKDLNLARIASAGDPIYLDSKELLDAVNDWVSKLKSGL